MPAARYAIDFLSGGNAANLIVLTAAAVIEAGLAENVLCYRAMNGRSGFRLGGGRDLSAYGITQFTAPFGWITYPQAMAMWCRRHMISTARQAEQLGEIAVTFRSNAVADRARYAARVDDHGRLHELAHDRRAVSHARYLPGNRRRLRRAGHLGRARARSKRKPVYISGGAYGGGPNQGEDLFDAIRWPDHSHNYAKYIADDLWRSAGMGPHDIDIAEIYDCFTYSVIMQLEGSSSARKARAARLCRADVSRATARCRSIPMAACLSEGYIHGLNHVVEAVQQLRGEAGPRQIPDVETCLTTAGAMTCGSAMVLRN